MRLPGTKFQDHRWKYVRNLLIDAAIAAITADDLVAWVALADADVEAAAREAFQRRLFAGLAQWSARGRGRMLGNLQGDTAYELATELVLAVETFPQRFTAFCRALANTHAAKGDFWLTEERVACVGKLVKNFAAELRDALDHGNYLAASGRRRVTVDFIYQCRAVERIARRILRDFAAGDLDRIGAILGRPVAATPFEAGIKQIGRLRPEWIVNWSAAQTPPGPLHTFSKKLSALKFHPEQIRDILELLEAGSRMETVADVAEDKWRDPTNPFDAVDTLLDASRLGAKASPGGAPVDPPQPPESDASSEEAGEAEWDEDGGGVEAEGGEVGINAADEEDTADRFATAPHSDREKAGADDAGDARRKLLIDIVRLCFGKEEEPLRIAIWQKLMPLEDWPEECFDAETGDALTVEQLAGEYGVSLPTFRKRREAGLKQVKECIAAGLVEAGRQTEED